MRGKKKLLAAMLCAFSMTINSAAVVAQDKDKKLDPKTPADQAPEVTNFLLPAQPSRFAFIQSEFSFGGPMVKGAPYSAEAVTETIQTLGDGNRIIQTSSSKIYRDGEGRTRREQSLKAIGPWAVSGEAPVMISIDDPVASVHYSLNSNTKTAHKMVAPQALDYLALDAAKAKILKSRPTLQANADETGVSSASGAGFGTVTSQGSTTVVNAPTVVGPSSTISRVSVARGAQAVVGSVASAAVMPLPGGFFWHNEGTANTESLGSQMIEGVMAEGQRVTVTIEAGKIGNERPIVTFNERWYSKELQTVIFSKNVDPRIGETTYKLINIDRSEPDSSLFQVPPDYTVEEGPGFGIKPMPPEFHKMEKRRKPNEN
ncbi:MAG TPA: hypothetical protein VFS27_07275 [Blastocatellia bacterium]|jgi:hypothetical protein|nr:hypothetical protein [Blastocatellia bacterium]